jgi:heat shock protein HslJ
MTKLLILLLIPILTISACTPQQSAPLVGTWNLTAYGAKDAPAPAVTGAIAFLTFGADGMVGGSGGCNSLGGTYDVDGNEITFSEITSTLMACDDERMKQEGVVTQVLTGTAEYEIEGNTLTLTNEDEILVFRSASSSYPYP